MRFRSPKVDERDKIILISPLASNIYTALLGQAELYEILQNVVRGILLDADGTVVRINYAHPQASVEALTQHGDTLPFEKFRPLIGIRGDKLLPFLIPELNREEGMGKQISDTSKEIFLSRYARTLQTALGESAAIFLIASPCLFSKTPAS
jgi:hypothetical protein